MVPFLTEGSLRQIDSEMLVRNMINDSIKEKIKEHALSEMPNECCGLLVQTDKGLISYPCQNVAEEPARFFKIKGPDYLKAANEGEIVGYYHSHPVDAPISDMDKEIAFGHRFPCVLYNVPKDQFFEFNLDENLPESSFELGKEDCLTFVEDYFQKLGIQLPSFVRDIDPHLFQNNADFFINRKYVEACEKIGLMRILEGPPELEELKQHDILLFFRPEPLAVHLAIYNGDGTISHRGRDFAPRISSLKHLIKQVTEVFRHRTWI